MKKSIRYVNSLRLLRSLLRKGIFIYSFRSTGQKSLLTKRTYKISKEYLYWLFHHILVFLEGHSSDGIVGSTVQRFPPRWLRTAT